MAATSVYDTYGRICYAISNSAGSSAAPRNTRVSYANDALDRLVSTTMPGSGTSRYAYGTLGRMTSRHLPNADASTLYKYDDLGRMRFLQDARQRAIRHLNASVNMPYPNTYLTEQPYACIV